MRLAGCLAIEIGVASVLLVGTGFATHRGASELRQRWDPAAARAWLERIRHPPAPPKQVATSGAPTVRQDLTGEGVLPIGVESSGTFLGMSDEILLDRIRNQPVTRIKHNRGGSSLSFRLELADGSRAAWKPAQTNLQTVPRKEVAAYRLNRLLGLNAVPPAAPRSLTAEELLAHLHPDSEPAVPRIRAEIIVGPGGRIAGAASYWVPVIKDSGFDTPEGREQTGVWLRQREDIPFQSRSMAAQVSTLVVFDFLIANPDRFSGGNMKMSQDGTQLFFMDNTMSFFLESQGPERNRDLLLRTQRFSRALFTALSRLDLPNLRRLMREFDGTEILTEAEMRAVVARREFAEAHIAGLMKEFGDAQVLFFP